MDRERFNQLLQGVGGLTQEEFDLGYHYCYDWDGLFIGPNDPEFEVCTCHPLTKSTDMV